MSVMDHAKIYYRKKGQGGPSIAQEGWCLLTQMRRPHLLCLHYSRHLYGILNDMIPANCIGTCTVNSGMWISTGRNQEETFSPFSIYVSGSQTGSKPSDLKKVAKPGYWNHSRLWSHGSTWARASKAACVMSGAHCLTLLQPSGGSFLSTLTHFLFHRGLFGWWPHTPRMLLRDEARHGARCNRKPEKGFSSL